MSDRMIVMTRFDHDVVTYAPFYIHSFHLVQPHLTVDAEKFNIRYADPSQIDNTPDKLKWYRYHKGLLQREVAEYAGIYEKTYCRYEKGHIDYYPIDVMEKIAQLFSVPVTKLLDDYNLFLYHGQGKRIRAMRQLKNMSQSQYAECLGVHRATLRKWEKDLVRITKQTWELLRSIG